MLKANKSAWFEKVFAVYNRNLFKRRFHSLHVSGMKFLHKKDAEVPLIIYANHSGWWDGLVVFEICRRAKLDFYVMMEEKQLKNLFLFRKLGAFSVVRENARKAIESVNYAVELLENPRTTLLIFPQGEILPNDARPLKFYNGLSKIIEKSGAVLTVPLAIRYEFLGEFKPQIFIKIGAPELKEDQNKTSSKQLTRENSLRLTSLLDELKTDILDKNFNDYERII